MESSSVTPALIGDLMSIRENALKKSYLQIKTMNLDIKQVVLKTYNRSTLENSFGGGYYLIRNLNIRCLI